MTEKLYYADTMLRNFDARVLSARAQGKQTVVVLDRTAFYPTGGGQLFDTGTLSDGQTVARVVGVEAVNGDVLHTLDRALDGESVRGEIDAARRFDLTQQHTGQHILSQSFFALFKAETISVHMTETNCTLDLPRHMSEQQQAEAEELANHIVQENRLVLAEFVDEEALAQMPLRKPPAAKHEKIRIVEIKDFDWSPCGGTHVRATGEVGLVKVVRAEKRGSEQRIEFICGMRALRDYRAKNDSVVALATLFGIKDSDLTATVQRLADESKETRRALNAARAELLDAEAEQLWNAEATDGRRLVSRAFTGRALDEVRQLAQRLKEKPATVILFAAGGDKPNIIFARSTGDGADMGKLLRETAAAFGGRGGGQPEMAQGGVAPGSDLAAVLSFAADKIRQMEQS